MVSWSKSETIDEHGSVQRVDSTPIDIETIPLELFIFTFTIGIERKEQNIKAV